MIHHLVMFSGGIGSWAAAKRVVERHGTEGVVLLFADTLTEDCDLYRFLDEAAANIDAPLVKVAEGRTPWQVFFDERFMGNSRVDPCSKILKRKTLDRWRDEHCDQKATTIYIGIDWTEEHRLRRVQERAAPWRYEAPMCDRPLLSKADVMAWAREQGLQPPRLYAMGFPHNNCAGACVKAGHAQWELLLRVNPTLYLEWEANEQQFRTTINENVSILVDRRGGKSRPMTLREFRERIEAKGEPLTFDESLEWGGCGCAVDSHASRVSEDTLGEKRP